MKMLPMAVLVVACLAGVSALATPAAADSVGYCVQSTDGSIQTCAACVRTPDLPGYHECRYIVIWN